MNPPASPLPDATDRRTTRRRGTSDEGAISLMLAVLFLGAVILAGLITDAGRVLHATTSASDLAGKAARVGAQQITLTSIRAGQPRLDPAAADTAARAYLTRHQATGEVTTADDTVTVTVTLHVPYLFLTMSGRTGETVTQTRSAVAVHGP
ncbi:pilus assembly protein TadG-related protein [Protofrankia symbiont of Coriaria ruscifolia]|uniref:pilus assembly protein TadG-related protein n=1 Tax=Protofrankia symbiont of Coriaria ruscifolia TaxID=1306542 RepID=UPI001F5FA0CE|nr:pilus assembly protein TadG-related protein [Protofrankia symbiont of Coriaria ruscifolia]